MEKLFKQYGQVDTTVNHHKEGTGLGLMISKQLIENVHGHVSVESTYGVGSTFSCMIPLGVVDWSPAGGLENFRYDEVEQKDEKEVFTAPDAKVLIVDDTKLNLDVAEALLCPIGMQIHTAESGQQTLQLLEKNTYDLIFMDHFMPGMDGIETVRRIRAFHHNPNQHIPVIALTADARNGVKEEFIANGMNDYIAKPIIIDTVYQVLEKWLPKEKIVR